jgi:hypothetical protein
MTQAANMVPALPSIETIALVSVGFLVVGVMLYGLIDVAQAFIRMTRGKRK